MQRTQHSTLLVDANGAGKDGFTNGDPGVTPATVVDADVMNSLQEEIANAVEAAGMTLALADQEQLLRAAVAIGVKVPFSGSGVGNGSLFTLGSLVGDTSLFSISSNQIVLPTFGLYVFGVEAEIESSTADASPQAFGLNVNFNSLTFFTAMNTRWSATAGHTIHVRSAGIMPFTSGTRTIGVSFNKGTGSGSPTGTIGASAGTLSIARLRAYE